MTIIIRLSIISLAMFVLYTSISGLGALFASAKYPIMAAGFAIEVAKYSLVYYVTSYYKRLSVVEITVAFVFTLITMVFTSAGVFAFLGESYQSSFSSLNKANAELSSVTNRLTEVNARILQIDTLVDAVPADHVTAKIRLIRENKQERDGLTTEKESLSKSISAAKNTVSETSHTVGPIVYLSRVTGIDSESLATWIILALTVCLDPLALFMTRLSAKIDKYEPSPTIETSKIAKVETAPTNAPYEERQPDKSELVITPTTSNEKESVFGAALGSLFAGGNPQVAIIPTKPTGKKRETKKPA